MALNEGNITESLFWLIPELFLTGIILLLTILIILPVKSDKWLKVAVFSGVVGLIAVTVFQFIALENNEICCLFGSDQIMINSITAFWKLLLSTAMLIVILIPLPFSMKRPRGEYFLLLMGVLLGGYLLVMANHFLMVIIALELISLSSYLLTGLTRLKGTSESAIKYFLFGATATAVTIYGISWLYGLTGELSLSENGFQVINQELPGWMPFMVIILVSSGILFKVAVAPWHIWVPDVYQETPTPIVAMFSVIPKLAGFAFLVRWVEWLNWPVEEIALLAILTMSIGNFAALRQKNVKRMMGYSSIAHSGFLMMALLYPDNIAVLLFYSTVYLFMNLGAFVLINYYERMYRITTFRGYNGFFNLSPLFSVLMVVCMIALTGLPPTAGFTAKLLIFTQVLSAYQDTGMTLLMIVFVFGIVNAVISFAYYVQIPYRMIFRPMTSSVNIFKKYSVIENYLSIILVLAVLILFFKPEWLMGWVNNSSFAF